MILILTRPDLKKNNDCPLSDVDIRTAVEALGASLVERCDRIEFHDFNGWIRVIKDRNLERPPGFLPKTHANGYGEADRIHILGYKPEADWYQVDTAPTKPSKKVVESGFSEKAPVTSRKLVIDDHVVATTKTK